MKLGEGVLGYNSVVVALPCCKLCHWKCCFNSNKNKPLLFRENINEEESERAIMPCIGREGAELGLLAKVICGRQWKRAAFQL